jgi:3',5'-cyclic-AMP phosphodiesterase
MPGSELPENAELMSVGTDTVVVTFTSTPDAEVATSVGDRDVVTRGPFHVAELAGLEPDTEYVLAVDGVPPDRWLPAHARTLALPTGRRLATVATANDTHFGETRCGITGYPALDEVGPILSSPPGAPPYPEVMNGAVVDEMLSFDPDAVVVKGDLTSRGRPDEYRSFLASYGRLGSRLHHVRGNHDALLDPSLAREEAPYTVDLAGITLAVLDTTVPGRVGGALSGDQLGWLDDVARDRTHAVLVLTHHPVWDVDASMGVLSKYVITLDDSLALLDVVRRRENVVGVLSGHTHANRVRRFARARQVPCVEVACTKDYPGAWGQYEIYEGGYVQVMRRVRAAAAFAWSEECRAMINGAYRDLVLGTIDDRCFTQEY